MSVLNQVRKFSLVATLAISSLATAAAAQTIAADEAARAALPENVRAGGELLVATSLQWAPFAYRSASNEAVGIDISLMNIIAGKLGLTAKLDDIKFPTIVPGVSTGRYHVGVNQLSITKERLAAVDMVPYFITTSVVLVQKGKTDIDINNLCGKTFVVTQGSVQVTQLEEVSKACEARGAQPITQQLYPSSAETLLAVANGRGDAFLTAAPQAHYIASVNDKVEVIPGDVNVSRAPAGIVVEKGNAAMRKAVGLALISAINDGSYQALLDEYGVGSGAVPVDTIRAAIE